MRKLIVLGAAILLLSSSLTLAQPATAPPSTEPVSPFAIRGIKGLWWEGLEKYRFALPWVADHHMNFLMFCYSSFSASGKDWRSEYTADELNGFQQLAQEADQRHVELCLSFNPGIWSKPPLVYSSDDDFQLALKKVKTVHARGIKSFALCLDDIGRKLEPQDLREFSTLQAAQAHFVNRLWQEMKSLSPRPRLIFCPSAYTTEDAEKHLDYIQTIGREIDQDVMMFWTGPVVCSPTITRADAEKFAAWIKRKPLVWDNYPVNDMFPWRPLEAPVKGRAPDLATAVEGVMANPMKQWHASKIPLATLASYLTDPAHYDPTRALEAAIAEYPENQHDALHALLDVYGSSFLGEKGYPPGSSQFAGEAANAQLSKLEALREKFSSNPALAELWKDILPTLDQDTTKLHRAPSTSTPPP